MADNFSIVKQEPVMDLSGNAGPVNAMRIDFVSLPSNTRAFVTIPLSEYSPQVARREIQALVDKIEDVHTLGQS